jgi:hypothetical protein
MGWGIQSLLVDMQRIMGRRLCVRLALWVCALLVLLTAVHCEVLHCIPQSVKCSRPLQDPYQPLDILLTQPGRVQIIACPEHDIQHLFPDDHLPSFDATFSALLDAAYPDVIQSELQRWCSFCFSPAFFSCCTQQPSLLSLDDDEEEIYGCGLKLCLGCEVKLREEFDGDSSAMAARLDLEPKAKAETEEMENAVVRADVGFLDRKGLLMKTVEGVSAQMEAEMEGQ